MCACVWGGGARACVACKMLGFGICRNQGREGEPRRSVVFGCLSSSFPVWSKCDAILHDRPAPPQSLSPWPRCWPPGGQKLTQLLLAGANQPSPDNGLSNSRDTRQTRTAAKEACPRPNTTPPARARHARATVTLYSPDPVQYREGAASRGCLLATPYPTNGT